MENGSGRHTNGGGGDARLMNVWEVAEYLKIAPTTVYRFARRGLIPGMRLNRAWRFKRELIDRHFDKMTV